MVVDETADGVVVLLLLVGLVAEELAQRVHADTRVEDRFRLVDALDRRLFAVVLVLDLADDLFEQVLDRHETGRAAVLVDDDGDVDLAQAQLRQQFVHALRLRDEVRRAGDLLQRWAAAFGEAAQQVLRVDDAGDVVDRLVVQRDAAEALFDDQLERVVDRLALLERHDIHARRHDLARRRILHLDDAADHLALFLFDRLAVHLDLGEAEDLLRLVLLLVNAALDDGRERGVDRRRDGAEDGAGEADERRETHAPALGVAGDDESRQRIEHGDGGE